MHVASSAPKEQFCFGGSYSNKVETTPSSDSCILESILAQLCCSWQGGGAGGWCSSVKGTTQSSALRPWAAAGSGHSRSQRDKGQTCLLAEESASYAHLLAEPSCSLLCSRTRDRVSPFLLLKQRRLQLFFTFFFQVASPLSSRPGFGMPEESRAKAGRGPGRVLGCCLGTNPPQPASLLASLSISDVIVQVLRDQIPAPVGLLSSPGGLQSWLTVGGLQYGWEVTTIPC